MNYVPKPDGHNHNISHESPLHEFARIALVFTIVIAGLFGVAAMLADRLASHITDAQEAYVMKYFNIAQSKKISAGPVHEYLNEILGRLHRHEAQGPLQYRVNIVCDNMPNAYAIPGGLIVVTSGLQAAVTSENGLSFVLAHELGHFHHRDHWRSVGRQFIFAVIGSSLGMTQVDAAVPLMVDLSFSRDQERQADEYGATLLRQEYKHLNGAEELFSYLLKNDAVGAKIPGFMSSHPVTDERLQKIQMLVQHDGNTIKTPLRVSSAWAAECQHKN